jgi:hypothetical protein
MLSSPKASRIGSYNHTEQPPCLVHLGFDAERPDLVRHISDKGLRVDVVGKRSELDNVTPGLLPDRHRQPCARLADGERRQRRRRGRRRRVAGQHALNLDFAAAALCDAEAVRRRVRQVDDAPGMKGPAIVDPHHDALAVGKRGDARIRRQR